MKNLRRFSCLGFLCPFLALIFVFSLLSPAASAETVSLKGIISYGAELGSAEQISQWTDIVSLAVSSGEKGDFVLGLRSDGKVLAAGNNDRGQCQVEDWENVVKIAAGDSISLGLCADGTVLCAGYGEKSAPDTSSWQDVVDIAAGPEFVLGVTSQGELLYSGMDLYNIKIWFSADRDNKVWDDKEDEMRFWSELSAVRAAGENILGLDQSGELRFFGFGPLKELPDFGGISDFAAGQNNGGVIDSQGLAHIWGDNSCYQCNIPREIFSGLALGKSHCLLLRPDGSAAAYGCDDFGQCQVGDWENLVALEAGNACSLGVTAEGRVLIAGSLR